MDKTRVITELMLEIDNSGDTDYEYRELLALEVVFMDGNGDMDFTRNAAMFDYSLSTPKEGFSAGGIGHETLYFLHNKGETPVALTANRANYVLLTDEADPVNPEVTAFLKKTQAIEVMLARVPSRSFEEIDAFRKANGINIDDTNRQGINLLHGGILSKNDSVVQGAIENGADLHKKVTHGFSDVVEPIHVAFLANNRNAVEALMNAGVKLDINLGAGKDSLAVAAVRANNIDAVKLLAEYGVPFKGLMIPMNWGVTLSALKFSQDRKMTEMVHYLEGLESQ
jgi:hypothetical protein